MKACQNDWELLPRDGIKLALLEFATQYSMLACGMCLEWAHACLGRGYQTRSWVLPQVVRN